MDKSGLSLDFLAKVLIADDLVIKVSEINEMRDFPWAIEGGTRLCWSWDKFPPSLSIATGA
jgi:hypothetical protein